MTDLANLNIKFLPGVGPKRAELLKTELNIASAEDLLFHFPYKYIDRSRTYRINEIDGNMPYIQLKGYLTGYELQGKGRQKRLTATFTDGTGQLELVWFKGLKYITDRYKTGIEYTIFGKPTVFGSKLNIVHPEIDAADEYNDALSGLTPYYHTTEKMKNHFLNSKAIQKIMTSLWKNIPKTMPETLPAEIISRANLMYLYDALKNSHFPSSPEALRKAQFRLKFEELFYLQLNILKYSKMKKLKYGGFLFHRIGHYFNTFYEHYLPFELTGAQKRVLREIRQDVGSGRQMNRLLQGDVGSGKTLVALMAALMAIDNGFQTCIMAPTEILSAQHFDTITRMLSDIGLHVELLTGSTKKSERERIQNALLSGETDILIGTHALLEDYVVFANLGLVIIDEQHRFGVAQRAELWKKNLSPPHILVMTATPIPRTLAMTVYGDLDVSVIDELPPGRKPVQTLHRYDNQRGSLYGAIRKQIEEGRQIYIVYPLIQESEKIDLKNLEQGYRIVREQFPEYEVCMVHGKMKPAEKEAQMQLFVSGRAQIMVATTVIEVGVNVPNASVMVIENAERFGLSQLHQLRGRVGRGADQSYCILVTSHKLSAETRKRLDIMVRSNDGFEISEADLQLRGPGDLEGTQQSGIAFDLKIANLAKDGQILQLARNIASEILDKDPDLSLPEHYVLKKQLEKIFRKKINWGAIS